MINETNMREVAKHIRALEAMGCAVAVFTPEELGNANPKHVCERMIESGFDAIDVLQDEENEENEENEA